MRHTGATPGFVRGHHPRHSPRFAARHSQRGQYLVSALLALVVFSLLVGRWASLQQQHYQQGRANAQGAALAQYGVGIRGFIASVQGGSITPPGNPYTVAGVNWLKAPSCGGLAGNPPAGFVPCSFTGGEFGAQFTTTITSTPATNAIGASTSFVVPPMNGQSADSAADLAAKIAFATLAQQTLPLNGMFLDVFANAPATATSQPDPSTITAANRGRVVLYANNAPSNDIWLRVDGTNQMLADLNMGGHSVKNAKNAEFSGDVRVHGVEQVDGGLVVDNGAVNANKGLTSPDVYVSGIDRYASQAIYDATTYTGSTSYTIPKPNCSAADGAGLGGPGASTPRIYTMIQNSGSPQDGNPSNAGGVGTNADALYSTRLDVTDAGSSWIVRPVVNATTYWLSATPLPTGEQRLTLNKSVDAANARNVVFVAMRKCN